MFGWIKRRLLARKARKVLDSVRRYEVCRTDQARARPVPPACSPSLSYSAPVHHSDPLVLNQALYLSAALDDGHRSSADCSSNPSSFDSSSSSDSSSSCSSSSSGWD